MKYIELYSVRQNNLKGFDLLLPFYHLIVVTGVSGAGKSSLVFDTLYAEGSRRYIETFSAYVRQFFERLPKPLLQDLRFIPPALAFPQGNFVKTSRSTVSTLTEIAHFIKMFYYHIAEPYCPICNLKIKSLDAHQMATDILRTFKNEFVYIMVPRVVEQDINYLREGLLASGFTRIVLQGKVYELDEMEVLPDSEEIEILLHRLRIEEEILSDLVSTLEQALQISDRVKVQTLYGEAKIYINKEECPKCGFKVPPKSPALFSFNTSQGACPECKGFGNLLKVDLEALVRYPEKSLEKGAIPALDFPAMFEVKWDLFDFIRKKGYSTDIPFKDYPLSLQRSIFEGEGNWYGLSEIVEWLEAHRYKPHLRIILARLRREVKCPTCKGARFHPQALYFKIRDINIAEFHQLEIKEANSFIGEFLKDSPSIVGERLAKEIKRRLDYLEGVGLSYLTLGRASRTLSGGELSRCLLTRALSSNLVETLYILDEPTTGLHPKDTHKVLDFLHHLVSQNNTVIVVEHDPEMILKGDFLVELGPKGGDEGGHLLYAGSPSGILNKDTPTSEALRAILTQREFIPPHLKTTEFLEIREAQRFNLKNISAQIPLGHITVIAGVSGSGKSTFLEEILYKGLLALKEHRKPEHSKEIRGFKSYYQVLYLTQEPLARSPRAIVATFMGIYPYLRKLLASTDEAKNLGYSEGAFSFNSELAQCENCKGLGFEIVEMQFLPDLIIPCEVCQGRRFKEEVLEIRWRGKNISEMLDLTVESALKFFGNHREIQRLLQILESLGLGYLRLGQPLSTLSGGEAQRLKIAELLAQIGSSKAIILLDEPTVGLHLKDIEKLLQALRLLKEKGHTVVIVEHHPEVMLLGDWILEFGPEGGEKGGYLLYQGELKNFLETSTPTAVYLKEYLQGKTLKETKPNAYQFEERYIKLRGIRHHNLQNIDLDLPRNKFIVITGVSGSGKSTLAFDVLFTEGQRRFLETLPAYLRQFFKLYEEIDFDNITGLPPTVALEQKSGEISPRSTVGTITEILPYLRLLYARASKAYCPNCGEELSPKSKEEILEIAKQWWRKHSEQSIEILATLVRYRKGHYRPLLESLLKRGYHRVIIDGITYELPPIPNLSRYREHTIEVFLGSANSEESFHTLLSKALREGKGSVILRTNGEELYLSQKRVCLRCGVSLPEPDPLLFAFNTKVGACPECQGIGKIEEKICPSCKGSRYRREVHYFKIKNLSLPELCELSIEEALKFIRSLNTEGREKIFLETLLPEITKRLEYLVDLGLNYLTLSRSADTLSAGEAKRVRISAEIGSNLTGVAYILDEPTIGLHPKDTQKLLQVLKKLRDKGNTVIVVEHDEEVILSGDFIVDLGPGGGKRGGKVVFSGVKDSLFNSQSSLTAKALRNRERKALKSKLRNPSNFLFLGGVHWRNLQNIDVQIPLGVFTCVVGVSGAGKSSLICEALYENLKMVLSKGTQQKLKGLRELKGFESLSEVYLVDHSPIGNTPRSIPATYIKVFDEIRRAYAQTRLARERGYREGRFSFNTEEGQCSHCKGQGKIKVEIKFLPAVYQTCEFCEGKRYNRETLEVTLRGKSIAEILEMDFKEARDFFKGYPYIASKLELPCKIGLDYLSLGQPSPTLSGGEAQRIKLAKELGKIQRKPVMYLMDEPTTGLHILDIEKLVSALQELVDKGHSVVVIEHNLELIKCADWIIELGPEGGEKGGHLIFQGPIEEFLRTYTPTSEALKKYLQA
ncbi:MAG: excinuclease ABC subunit UvrA [Caldimicrobium sp.]|nr:excinuclease ABC subunit UvrA [Caldimicrobium sp.]MCX7873763.1 excinuclease ABC subunit UvrA [Caldimicrobium sp.]MDW8093687.1 excinuclease ABC subunit UvrA [Caldimicrobium sp.]